MNTAISLGKYVNDNYYYNDLILDFYIKVSPLFLKTSKQDISWSDEVTFLWSCHEDILASKDKESIIQYYLSIAPKEFIDWYIYGYLSCSLTQIYPYNVPYVDSNYFKDKVEKDFLDIWYSNNTGNNDYYNKFVSSENVTKIKKLTDDAIIPTKANNSDSGLDLYIVRKIKEVNGVHFYGTGIAIQPPNGVYFEVVPRSSMSKSGYILANSIGVIDSSYTGEIILALMPVMDDPVAIVYPYRICQLIPRYYIPVNLVEVDTLDVTERSDKGFGSSGTN